MSSTSESQLLERLIDTGFLPPFIHSYPMRGTYDELDVDAWTIDRIWDADKANAHSRVLHLYFHIPFCNYRCGFCNLYTVISRDSSLYDRYTDAIIEQLRASERIIRERDLRTIYFGGGTPGILGAENFRRIFATLDEVMPSWRVKVTEVNVEVSPEVVVDDDGRLCRTLVELGVTRLSMGIQSFIDSELAEMGRKVAKASVAREACRIIKNTGVPNFSADLIMGGSGQTDESWMASLNELIAIRPETVTTYFLAVRPETWYTRTDRYEYLQKPDLYHRYDLGYEALVEAGYIQARCNGFKLPGKGGLQHTHWMNEPVLPIGAGSRGYNSTIDYHIGGVGVGDPTLEQIEDYMQRVEQGAPLIRNAYVFNDEQRIRKRLVLSLIDLDLAELERYNVQDHLATFASTLDAAVEHGLLRRLTPTRYQSTPKGFKYRDVLSWMLSNPDTVEEDAAFFRAQADVRVDRIKTEGDPAFVPVHLSRPSVAGAAAAADR